MSPASRTASADVTPEHTYGAPPVQFVEVIASVSPVISVTSTVLAPVSTKVTLLIFPGRPRVLEHAAVDREGRGVRRRRQRECQRDQVPRVPRTIAARLANACVAQEQFVITA